MQQGQEIQVTHRGKVIARIVPEGDESQEAKAFLASLRKTAYGGDVVSPIDDAERTADDDDL